MSEIVPDAVLLADLKNTQLECEAYKKLEEGYETLANLPENSGALRSSYKFESSRYAENYVNCHKLLDKLEGLKKDRGL